MRTQILLCFNGKQDPFRADGDDGPILSLLDEVDMSKRFEKLLLFCTPDNTGLVQKTVTAITERHAIVVESYPTAIDDPTNYEILLSEMRRLFGPILKNNSESDFIIFLSPGTPQMQACWWHLAQTGEIPARRILALRPKHEVSVGQSRVTEYAVRPLAKGQQPMELHCLPQVTNGDIETAKQAAGIIGEHPAIKEVLQKATQAARSDATVLIEGENGTGKDLLANFIHAASRRKANPFVIVHSGAITDSLLESSLFGHVKGAFTGAIRDKQGYFDTAHGGTLFLDEIGDISHDMQVKLLRALQQGEIQAVGAERSHKVDVRVIAATNKVLAQMVKENRFREDLYYRLNVLQILLPPLRRRGTDIALLANHFVRKKSPYGAKRPSLTNDAIAEMMRYRWPGNVRELENVVERCLVHHPDSKHIDAEAVRAALSPAINLDDPLSLPLPHEGFDMNAAFRRAKARLYELAMQYAGGNQMKAAALLGVTNKMVSKHFSGQKNPPK